MILLFCLIVTIGCTVINAYEGNRKMTWLGFALICGLLIVLALRSGELAALP